MKRWWGVVLLAWALGATSSVPQAAAAEEAPATQNAEFRALSAYAGAVRPIMVRVIALVQEAGQRMADQMEALPEPPGGMEALVDSVLSEAGAAYRVALLNALLERLSALPVPATAQTIHDAILAGMHRARVAVEADAGTGGGERILGVDTETIADEVQATFQKASSDLSERLARAAVAPLPVVAGPSEAASSGLLDRLAAEPGSGEATAEVSAPSAASETTTR